MAISISIWQPGKCTRNAVLAPLFIVLFPLIVIIGLIVRLAMWPINKLSPSKPITAWEIVEKLDSIMGGATDHDMDYGLQVITRCPFADERLGRLKLRALAICIPPWTAAAVDELRAIRESARAIAAGDKA